MTQALPGRSHQVSQFGWLINNFADNVPGVAHAVVISVDGLLLTASHRLPVDRAEQMSAIAAGIVSLNLGAARVLGAEQVTRVVVEMDYGVLLLTSIRDGSCLAVLATRDCDVSQVAYEMTVLVDQVGQILTPQLRATLAAG
ncbi:MAG TPA: roadblock/LC7 domain-containing protein [Actinophytocola sp.]|uniref:roadblock/LC7 domain-containing protein n=1 Tax=Actinophytocola sp. TaxID=1872138 RepID=UPI002DF93DBA|nr:roadblock/LC7 domain-containing protein [Actinophytocola sp.]